VKKVAIVQSNYIPWKDYFDLIAAMDEFIIGDNAQYTHRDRRNRNGIKTAWGVQWLTVPVKGKSLQRMWETEIDGTAWAKDHWRILPLNYRWAPANVKATLGNGQATVSFKLPAKGGSPITEVGGVNP
jgi:hypothetical protein